jgi:hypothetical protein
MMTSRGDIEKFGYEELPIFMLARDGAVVADDFRAVRFDAEDIYTDDLTGKPVANVTTLYVRRWR